MKMLLRTELLNQMFMGAIESSGGHPDLRRMCVDWTVAPSFGGKAQSYICLHERTEYVISLFTEIGDLDIAVIGYDLEGDTCVVRQIQGQWDCPRGILPRHWERVLLATVVRAAQFSSVHQVEVVPSWMSSWIDSGDPHLVERLRARYDGTPKALGFICAAIDSGQRHIRKC